MYPRYTQLLHRHLALVALYLLMTLTVLGLVVILCIFNSTELPFVVKSDYLINAVPKASIEASELVEQQPIYIDDIYNGNGKPQRDEYLTSTDKAESSTVDIGLGSGTLDRHPVLNELDNDNENGDDGYDDAIASGSGSHEAPFPDTNAVYDLETKEFIKRISQKLWRLTKANATQRNTNRRWLKLTKELTTGRSEYSLMGTTTSPPALASQPLPMEAQVRTRRIIGNERKSAERSRQLLLCEKGQAGGSELCRMLFKET